MKFPVWISVSYTHLLFVEGGSSDYVVNTNDVQSCVEFLGIAAGEQSPRPDKAFDIHGHHAGGGHHQHQPFHVPFQMCIRDSPAAEQCWVPLTGTRFPIRRSTVFPMIRSVSGNQLLNQLLKPSPFYLLLFRSEYLLLYQKFFE